MGWWGKSSPSTEQSQKPTESTEASASSTTQPPFDPSKLPEPRKLPEKLQQIVDKSDKDSSFFDDYADG